MDTLLWGGLAALAGGLLAVQGPSNALLARSLANPFAATLVSVCVSAVGALAILLATGGPVQWRAAPPWLYALGGLLGITVVLAGAVVTPRLGVAVFVGCLVLGRLLVGLLLDHLGAFGIASHPVSPGRVAGIVLVLGGIALFRLY